MTGTNTYVIQALYANGDIRYIFFNKENLGLEFKLQTVNATTFTSRVIAQGWLNHAKRLDKKIKLAIYKL